MFRKSTFIFVCLAPFLSACGSAPTAAPTDVPAASAAAPTAVPATVAAETPTAAPTATPTGLTFTDGLGRTVKLSGPAQRIVTLAPSNTEILYAIGAGKQVVGRDDVSDFPTEVKAIPSLGGFDKYNVEQLVALKPDLVLLAEINPQTQVKQFEDLGLTVYYLLNPKTIEEMYANMSIVAQLTGHEKEAADAVAALKTRMAAVDDKLKAVTTKPVVFYELDSTDPAKPFTAGADTFVDQLIVRAGGINMVTAAGIKDAYPQVSVEQVVKSDPDMIILGDSMWGTSVASVAQRPGWSKLKAVLGAQVYSFDDNTVSRPGPRLVDGLEALAKLLHPELYK